MEKTNQDNLYHGEICSPKPEGMSDELYDIAEKLKTALKELDGYDDSLDYDYFEGDVVFDLNGLNEDELNSVRSKVNEVFGAIKTIQTFGYKEKHPRTNNAGTYLFINDEEHATNTN